MGTNQLNWLSLRQMHRQQLYKVFFLKPIPIQEKIQWKKQTKSKLFWFRKNNFSLIDHCSTKTPTQSRWRQKYSTLKDFCCWKCQNNSRAIYGRDQHLTSNWKCISPDPWVSFVADYRRPHPKKIQFSSTKWNWYEFRIDYLKLTNLTL